MASNHEAKILMLEQNQIRMERELGRRLEGIEDNVAGILEILTATKGIWRFLVWVSVFVGGVVGLFALVQKIWRGT